LFQIIVDIFEAVAAGFLSTVCMTLFETPFWARWGMQGVAEWQVNAVMVAVIWGNRVSEKSRDRFAIVMHLVHGIVLGVIFLFILLYVPRLSQSLWVMGLAIIYSVLLWVISPWVTRRVYESRGNIRMTSRGLMVSFGSHIIYGLVLGLLVAQIV
jgi:hypothetical protein